MRIPSLSQSTALPIYPSLTKYQQAILASVQLAALVLSLSALVGCAGMAKGKDTSMYRKAQSPALEPSGPATAGALVVIRYPAIIHADAETLYISSFAVNAIGGEVPYAQFGKPQTARIAQALVAKSSYYAMSLYRELSAALPEHSVLLSPHIIDWSEERKLHSRPILASEQLPGVLTIDFNIYSFPDVNEMMDAPPVTFGDLVTPLFVVKSSPWVAPSINGLMIVSEPMTGSAWRQAGVAASRQLESRLEGRPVLPETSLDFIAFLGERSTSDLPIPLKPVGEAYGKRLSIESYPVEKIQMDGQLMVNLEETYANDPFARDFVRGASTRILQALNQTNHQKATFFSRQAALARFDEELARVFFVQSEDESVQARMRLAEALVKAELEFLSAQSQTIYQGTYEGDYGVKMRKIIEAEYRMLEERRRLARVQNMTTAVAALAMAGTVYGATVSTTASTAMVAGLTGVSLVGSVWAMNRAMDARAESEEINEAFIARMAPAFERQNSVQVEWLESREIITARGFAEFRNKTLTLYQSRVRSMAVDTQGQCDFRSEELNFRGRWYGRCDGGLATGRGYGVVANAAGDSVEYIGHAERGLASGVGGLLVRRSDQLGATYFEGSFRQGRPHGVVRVEQAGELPRVREFRHGEDVGRGNARLLPELEFSPVGGDRGAVP
jgi:hypothetical protein